ncbi:hypothetical protein TBK1r_14270 [Stieleria magnilauensis]|uniref:Uncharacterized protein n=2 Tax=Stieleria magnilauensis TaxID=2527963 RepID=A0ABX5XL50_9BACT|nr:hypothetical protein TBK1r_14270 [Planctomycetes bacterium TBK1r]
MLAGDVDLGLALDVETDDAGHVPAAEVATPRTGATASPTAPAIRLESIRPTSPDPLARTANRQSTNAPADELPQEPSDKKRKTGPSVPSTDDASPSDKPLTDDEGGMIAVRSPEIPSDHADELASFDFTADLGMQFLTVDSDMSDVQRTPAVSPATLRSTNLSQSAVTASTPPNIQSGPPLADTPIQPLVENPVKPLVENPVRSPAASGSDHGGMIRVYSTALPTLGPTALSSKIRIELAPSTGHYRNFRIAETPGLDSERDSERSATLVSRWTQGDSVDKNRIKRKSVGVRGFPRSVTNTPSVVSGSALLSGEIAGRSEPANAARSQ